MKRIAGLTITLIVFIIVLSGCSTGLQFAPTPTPTLDPDNPEITILMDEFRFTPDHIRLVVGQKVTLHVINTGQEEHEIMIGRNPLRAEDGTLGDGFEHDFFALTQVSVEGDAEVMGMNGESMDMSMDMNSSDSDSSMDMGSSGDEGSMNMDSGDSSEDMEMANGGMVMLMPEKEATITFTVTPEMFGAWTIGCFEGGDLRHLDLGMAGILYVRDFDK